MVSEPSSSRNNAQAGHIPLERTSASTPNHNQSRIDEVNHLRDEVSWILAVQHLHNDPHLKPSFPEESENPVCNLLHSAIALLLGLESVATIQRRWRAGWCTSGRTSWRTYIGAGAS